MTKYLVSFLLISFCGFALSHEAPRGYVLKNGEGEEACCGVLIKASPRSGSRAGLLILQPMPAHFSTGIHYHTEADEFFYVVSGSGTATVAGEEHPIEAGDVIFVPAGEDHRLMTQSSGMEIIEFLDKPGLDDEFRGATNLGDDFTLEELNAISRPNGTVYRTLE